MSSLMRWLKGDGESDSDIVRRIASDIDKRFSVSGRDSVTSLVESMISANELPLAIHQLRQEIEEREIGEEGLKVELLGLITKYKTALEHLFQGKYKF